MHARRQMRAAISICAQGGERGQAKMIRRRWRHHMMMVMRRGFETEYTGSYLMAPPSPNLMTAPHMTVEIHNMTRGVSIKCVISRKNLDFGMRLLGHFIGIRRELTGRLDGTTRGKQSRRRGKLCARGACNITRTGWTIRRRKGRKGCSLGT